MPDCFIIYAGQDLMLAQVVRTVLEAHRVSVFLGPVSLGLGVDWPDATKRNLASCKAVILLASEVACRSPYVQEELGLTRRVPERLVAFTWDVRSSELPGWVDQSRVLDLRGGSLAELSAKIGGIAKASQLKRVLDILLILVGAVSAFVLISPDGAV